VVSIEPIFRYKMKLLGAKILGIWRLLDEFASQFLELNQGPAYRLTAEGIAASAKTGTAAARRYSGPNSRRE
jgi:hypothetical protein